jgi:hypothetical protein
MVKLNRAFIGMLALTLLALPVAPHRAAAQAGTKTYEVTVTNITNSKQGLSPLLLATHPASVHAWQMGQQASKGLEMVAEDGMPDMLASELKGSATDVQTTKAHLLPGDSITVRITARDGDMLSAATMLIQTNDGFTGLDSVALTDGDKETVAYDAGTEDNTEAATDVPGPPFGGKSDAPDTNPHQPISMHPGIAGKANVTPDFNWSGPVAKFSIRTVDTSVVPSTPLYDVTVTNITNSKQGLSPLVLATHPASAHAWQMGQQASKGLEMVAEDGMPDMLASELKGIATDVQTTHAHLLPGDSITVRIAAKPGDMLSAATMLIQTNDGFTGLDSVPVTEGSQDTVAYDAGTEDNTEAATDVPGPPFGGKSDAPDTNPHQPISMHQGITGKANVTPDFNWSGPVAKFTITGVSTISTQPPAAPSVPATNPATNPPSAPVSGVMPVSGPSTMEPGMPHTGAGDAALWLMVVIALGVALTGLTLRRGNAIWRQ